MVLVTEVGAELTIGQLAGDSIRVLLVEENRATAAWLANALGRAGMTVEEVADRKSALSCKSWFRPDIVLIDLGLPDPDGLTLLERLARDGDCGVVILSTDDTEPSRVAGFDRGADDYLVKPPPPGELVARIRALHRRLTRCGVGIGSAVRPPQVVLDSASRCLVGPGRVRTPLTEAEWAILEMLVEADGASVSREWLGRVALKRALRDFDRSVDQLVMKLRRKIAAHGVVGRIILSSRGLGYVMPEPERFAISTEAVVAA